MQNDFISFEDMLESTSREKEIEGVIELTDKEREESIEAERQYYCDLEQKEKLLTLMFNSLLKSKNITLDEELSFYVTIK